MEISANGVADQPHPLSSARKYGYSGATLAHALPQLPAGALDVSSRVRVGEHLHEEHDGCKDMARGAPNPGVCGGTIGGGCYQLGELSASGAQFVDQYAANIIPRGVCASRSATSSPTGNLG